MAGFGAGMMSHSCLYLCQQGDSQQRFHVLRCGSLQVAQKQAWASCQYLSNRLCVPICNWPALDATLWACNQTQILTPAVFFNRFWFGQDPVAMCFASGVRHGPHCKKYAGGFTALSAQLSGLEPGMSRWLGPAKWSLLRARSGLA